MSGEKIATVRQLKRSWYVFVGEHSLKAHPLEEMAIEEANTINSIFSARLAEMKEKCAVTAWRIGMEAHLKTHDTREVGSMTAAAIRAMEVPK